MTKQFWVSLAALVDILGPLVEAMRLLEADDAFISIVAPVLHKAFTSVHTAAVKRGVPEGWLTSLRDILNVYFTKYLTPAQIMAWFLDPKQVLTAEQEDSFVDRAKQFLDEYVESALRSDALHEFERFRTVRRALFGDGAKLVPPSPDQGVNSREAKLELLVTGANVLSAWSYRDISQTFPNLSGVASLLLGIRASSGSVERYFSVVRIVHTAMRNRLRGGAPPY
jgi:hypothetical protein